MKKAKTMFGFMAILVIGLIATSSLVSAYRGDYSTQGSEFSDERHEAMDAAMDSLDYDAWYELMTENGRHPRVVDLVTEENFETFVEAHEAGKNGDFSLAKTIRAQLGLNNGVGPRDGTGFGKGQGNGPKDGSGHGRGQGEGHNMKGSGRNRATYE